MKCAGAAPAVLLLHGTYSNAIICSPTATVCSQTATLHQPLCQITSSHKLAGSSGYSVHECTAALFTLKQEHLTGNLNLQLQAADATNPDQMPAEVRPPVNHQQLANCSDCAANEYECMQPPHMGHACNLMK